MPTVFKVHRCDLKNQLPTASKWSTFVLLFYLVPLPSWIPTSSPLLLALQMWGSFICFFLPSVTNSGPWEEEEWVPPLKQHSTNRIQCWKTVLFPLYKRLNSDMFPHTNYLTCNHSDWDIAVIPNCVWMSIRISLKLRTVITRTPQPAAGDIFITKW